MKKVIYKNGDLSIYNGSYINERFLSDGTKQFLVIDENSIFGYGEWMNENQIIKFL